MKRILSLLCCFFMSLLAIAPLNEAEAVSKGKIVFVPHDDRPTSGAESAEPLEMLGYEVVMPPFDLLGGLDKIGNPDKLAEWTKENITGADAVVISSDSMLYGGLVASRRHELSEGELQKRLNVISDLKKENKKLNVYVFGSLMRTPSCPENAGSEEPDYYSIYGAEIFQRSALMDKAEMNGLTVNEDNKLKQLKKYIPQDIWNDWYNRRQKNIEVTKKLIDFADNGTIDYLIVGKDDNAPLSATHMESRHLTEYAVNVPKTKFQLLAGIDEFATLSLTRAVNKHENIVPKINVRYNIGKGEKTIPAFSDETIGSSITNEIIIVNGEEVSEPDKADLVLLVNTNPDGRTGDGNALADMSAYTDSPRYGTYEFADLVGKMLNSGYNVAIADIAFANSSDNALMKVMKERDYLMKLRAYAGWNTPTNSTGFVLGQGVMACRLPQQDCHRLLMERFLDDWCYQGNVRVDTMNMLYNEYGVHQLDKPMGSCEKEASIRTAQMIKNFAERNLPYYPQIKDLTFYFPWHITFIGGINLPK